MDEAKFLREMIQAIGKEVNRNDLQCPVCGENVEYVFDYTPQTQWEPENIVEEFQGACVNRTDAEHVLMWHGDEDYPLNFGYQALLNHMNERSKIAHIIRGGLEYLQVMKDKEEELEMHQNECGVCSYDSGACPESISLEDDLWGTKP